MTGLPIIPVVLAIDVEPDARELPPAGPPEWHGVEPSFALFERWRSRLAAATGRPARFSWFWRADPQLAELHGDPAWAPRHFRRRREQTAAHGDEHGLHPHLWRRRDGGWIQDLSDPAWAEHCVRSSFAAFAGAVGRRCRSTRFGDRWLDDATVALLRRLRVRVDLTVEPGARPVVASSTAPLPDYSGVMARPYRPSRDDFRRPAGRGGRGLVKLPQSAAVIPGPLGEPPRLRCLHTWEPTIVDGLDALLADPPRPPYVALATRTNLGLDEWSWAADRAEQLLTHLAEHPLRDRFAFTTPLDALRILRRARRVR